MWTDKLTAAWQLCRFLFVLSFGFGRSGFPLTFWSAVWKTPSTHWFCCFICCHEHHAARFAWGRAVNSDVKQLHWFLYALSCLGFPACSALRLWGQLNEHSLTDEYLISQRLFYCFPRLVSLIIIILENSFRIIIPRGHGFSPSASWFQCFFIHYTIIQSLLYGFYVHAVTLHWFFPKPLVGN